MLFDSGDAQHVAAAETDARIGSQGRHCWMRKDDTRKVDIGREEDGLHVGTAHARQDTAHMLCMYGGSLECWRMDVRTIYERGSNVARTCHSSTQHTTLLNTGHDYQQKFWPKIRCRTRIRNWRQQHVHHRNIAHTNLNYTY